MYPGLVKWSFTIYLLDNVQDHDETVVTVLWKVLQSLFLASDGTLVSFDQHLSSLQSPYSPFHSVSMNPVIFLNTVNIDENMQCLLFCAWMTSFGDFCIYPCYWNGLFPIGKDERYSIVEIDHMACISPSANGTLVWSRVLAIANNPGTQVPHHILG